MAKGRSRKSSSVFSRLRRKRIERLQRELDRRPLIETLEGRQLMAIGPEIIGVQPNNGELLHDGDIRNVAPREIRFQFNAQQAIDVATLPNSIQITRAGSDHTFDVATTRTDFNTRGAVVVEFQALASGAAGNDITLTFTKSDRGPGQPPLIDVQVKSIVVELNTNRSGRTTAAQLVNSLNANVNTRDLIRAVLIAGPSNTDITSPVINYSPVRLTGANAASVRSNFNSNTNLDITFTSAQTGPASNGASVEITKSNKGGAGPPTITVDSVKRIVRVDLNSNPGNETTAEQLVSVFNANAAARALMTASLRVGDPNLRVGQFNITYSPLVLTGADDVTITPGFVGLGDSTREVIFRFAETPVDDVYRINVDGTGTDALRNADGLALGDSTDDGLDDGEDFSLQFELDLAAQIQAVVPQPVFRTANNTLSQSQSQIEVYFNDDDLDPIYVTDPNFYQLIFTNDTVQNSDDVVYRPIAVQYFADSDRAMLTFAAPLHQLGSGAGTFRLRIGTDEVLASRTNPMPPTRVNLADVEVGSAFDTARDLGSVDGSQIVTSAISPQVYTIDLPGGSDEPGHRNIREQIETHLLAAADAASGLTTHFYNFRADYGADPSGRALTNLISADQKERAREIFELYGQNLGVQFVETTSQGFTVATGDLRALDPTIPTGPGGVIGVAGTSILNNQPTLVMDQAENWYNGFGASDDPLRISWFETAIHEIGHLIGLGHTYELPPGTVMGSEPALAFDNATDPIYPGDHDIAHGRYLHRNEGKDIDLYRFQVAEAGRFSAETIAERRLDSSLLDSAIALYRQDQFGKRELIARNDDYFSEDSFLTLDLQPGVYFIGVSAAGNEDYNPAIEDSGFGGVTEGEYDLRLTFRPKADRGILDTDNSVNHDANELSIATPLDGDGDGVPGGVFNFWFRVDATPLFVDKAAAAGGNGSLNAPFRNIDDAMLAARSGDVVRIVGNGGTDGNLATPADAKPYEIGFDSRTGQELTDGSALEIPKGVTVQIDRGAVLKLRRARIAAGSSSPLVDRSASALQVLGTPRMLDIAGQTIKDAQGTTIVGSVYFTSLNDDTLGGDSTPTTSLPPQAGDRWGGLAFRNDLDATAGRFDYEQRGIFLNYINHADMRYGGSAVVVNGVAQTIAPIDLTGVRPTITYNTVRDSANAAIAADPDSFAETNFHDPIFQTVPFTSDYARVGPAVYGNTLIDNSINGLFIRTQTPAAGTLQQMTVSGRFDDTDVVHVISETLNIRGTPGGPVQTLTAPSAKLITTTALAGGELEGGIYNYKIVFVDTNGEEGPPSDATKNLLVDGASKQSVRLTNLPTATAPWVARRIYRSEKSDYVFVAQINATDTQFLDDGTQGGGLLAGSTKDLQRRLHGRLAVDPGTIVKLSGAGIETGFGAQLIAEGIAGSPVVFTSLNDRRFGGSGTFATGSSGATSTAPAAGDWSGLFIGHTSSASLDYAVLAYGGGVAEVPGTFAAFNVLEIHQADARVAHSTIEQNAAGSGGQSTPNRAGRGANADSTIFVRGAQPVLVSNVIQYNRGPSINIDANSLNSDLVSDPGRSTGQVDLFQDVMNNSGPLVRDNRIAGNEYNAMQIRGATLTTQGVWDDTDITHLLLDDTIYVPDFHTSGGLRIQSSATESLLVKMRGATAGITASGRPLDIEDRIGGTVQLVGQPGRPVVLTSLYDCSVGAGFTPGGIPQQAFNACDVQIGAPIGTSGAVILDGGDRDDHGFNFGGVNIDGWLFIEQILNFAIAESQNNAPNDVLIVGASGFALNAITTVAGTLGLSTAVVTGAQITTVNFNDYKVIYIPSDETNVFGGITAADSALLGARKLEIQSFINAGGSFVALTQEGLPNPLEFVELPNPFVIVPLGGGGNLYPQYKTPAAIAAGFTISDAELSNGAPYHNYFIGPPGFNSLLPFAMDEGPDFVQGTADDGIVTLGLGGGSLGIGVTGQVAQPGDWRSLRFDAFTNDRNVAVATENETGAVSLRGVNETPGTAQFLGELAPHEKAGDETLRLGFEIHGAINNPSDVDVYSFEADQGTEVWLDIDRTTFALDTVVELVDETGRVIARSDDSGDENNNPGLLFSDPTLAPPGTVNPLNKSPFLSNDLYTTNPRDAGMRVVLPGPAGSTNTYHVRVRSGGPNLNNVTGGLTQGVYQLQIRLGEADEFPGSTVRMGDLRYAASGIELLGLPAHSPLLGDDAETPVPGNITEDDNNTLGTADALGNLIGSERGSLSVAGELTRNLNANGVPVDDVDWYQFQVRYDSIQNETSFDPRHLAAMFDIDYADGFARANTNLWVFDDQGRLLLAGGDSDVAEDRGIGDEALLDDLSRGSLGDRDAYIGPVELPAVRQAAPGVAASASRTYFVAVSSNAQIPGELQQFLTPAAVNPDVRLEPVNSVARIAEDHIDSPGSYTTASRPQVPLLFGNADEVTLFAAPGHQISDGESFTVKNFLGNSATYEFDLNGVVTNGRFPIPYELNFTENEIAAAIAEAINADPPVSASVNPLNSFGNRVPTADQPVLDSTLLALAGFNGDVTLSESVRQQVLIAEVATTDPFTGTVSSSISTRTSFLDVEPEIRQSAARGETKLSLLVSRPAAIGFNLSDVSLFVTERGFVNRTELLSIDPFTGAEENRIGATTGALYDVALRPDGLLYGYTVPDTVQNDTTTGRYIEIDPSSTNPAALGTDLGPNGIQTHEQDPMNPANSVRSNVGVGMNALTFGNDDVDFTRLRGFAVGNRTDAFVDPTTGQVVFGPPGIPSPTNIIFEFDPQTGVAFNPPGFANRTAGGLLTAGGTQIVDRGTIETSFDAFPSGGNNTSISGVEATTLTTFFGLTTTNFTIEDGDIFEIDDDADPLTPTIVFEFDTGPEMWFDVAAPQILVDGDSFLVDGMQFEFDTGSVFQVTALNGNQLVDGGRITITDNAPNPSTVIFEFDNNGNSGGNTAIPFTNNSNQQAIIQAIITAINNVANFNVNAVQLPGTTRITLFGESATAGAVMTAAGVALIGAPGVSPMATAIPIEETFNVNQIGQAIMTVIDGTQGGNFQAGARGNRLNFLGALTSDFSGITNPAIFLNFDLNTGVPTGIGGTINPLNVAVPFLASDNAADIADRVNQAVNSQSFNAQQIGSTVRLDSPLTPQPTFVCFGFGSPPQLGAPGLQDCPLQTGGIAPGGSVTGIAFVGSELFAVSDQGGLFRVANSFGGSFSYDSAFNVGDYIDGSQERLEAVNQSIVTTIDPDTGEPVETVVTEPVQFTGLVAGPRNTENGRYANLLFGTEANGRIFAFDTFGRPQPVFANGAYFIETGIFDPTGLAFGNLDDTLWHVTTDNQLAATGHGVVSSFDGSRVDEDPLSNFSFYFGYEDEFAQPQFGETPFNPGTPQDTYDFPGGARGSLVSNPFSLDGYSTSDRPALYFNYFLETEEADATDDTTLLNPFEFMRDSFRVFVSGADGRWKLLATNNSDTATFDYNDEFDSFETIDPITGNVIDEQPTARVEAFDATGNWRQAKIDLSEYAGQQGLRLRFDFNSAGGFSTGGLDANLDLAVSGNELRAIPGLEIQDGDMFTLTDLAENPDTGFFERVEAVGFEFDLGPTIVAPTGAAIDDGDLFNIDGRTYEFDRNNQIGNTAGIPNTRVTFVGNETAAQMATLLEQALVLNPPPPVPRIGNLIGVEPNDKIPAATSSGLTGLTETYNATGIIGDNSNLPDFTQDVDMVSFFLEAGDSVTISTDTRRLPTSLDSFLRLFDVNGNQLAVNDDVDPTNPNSRDSRLQFTATTRGEYIVGISSNHNLNYPPIIQGEITTTGLPTFGQYNLTIAVKDGVGSQRVGNRLNLPNVARITPVGLPASFVEGQRGVAAGLENPFADLDPTLPDLPVVPVRIHAAMTELDVADQIQIALADFLAGGNVDAIKRRHEAVQVLELGVGDAGPLGLSGVSDPTTALANSGLFGDRFGAFDASAFFNGQTPLGFPGAQGMWNNQFEGLYLDDLIIGFAGRGEMVTGSTAAASPAFITNTLQSAGEINEGPYQLEIRQGQDYGYTLDPPDPTLFLHRQIDVNDRLTAQNTLAVSPGYFFADGQTFELVGNGATVTFEFQDLASAGGVMANHVAIPFDTDDSDVEMARRVRDAINDPNVQQLLQVRAASWDGIAAGTASTSNRINLFGDVSVVIGLTAEAALGNSPLAESNDSLGTAIATGIVPGSRDGFRASGIIGDNPNLKNLAADIDLYEFQLRAGELITIDIDAVQNGSPLDSEIRVFNSQGQPVELLDANGDLQPVASDDAVAPNDTAILLGGNYYYLPANVINRDSYLSFLAPADGVYFVGVSGFDNTDYDPLVQGSGRPGKTGAYEIEIQRPLNGNGLQAIEFAGRGDRNIEREQGQILIESSRISNSSGFGVVVDVAQTQVAAQRNLRDVNTTRLATGLVIANSVLFENRSGGIDLGGFAAAGGGQAPVVPFARIVNNTIVGPIADDGTIRPSGIGVRIRNNSSPTLLNNVFSGLVTGIDADASSNTTVVGGSLYHVTTNPTVGVGLGDFPIRIDDPTVELFVNRAGRNFYPSAGSAVIDASIDSLEDREAFAQIRSPLGFAESPILAPRLDATGQFRTDDLDVSPPAGLGENVFKDRGAQDRSDFIGPTAGLTSPLDNGVNDLDPSFTLVNLLRASLNNFSLQLDDHADASGGIGIDDSSISRHVVRILQDNRTLIDGEDYAFEYDSTSNIIRLTPLSGVWDLESNYVLHLINRDQHEILSRTGADLTDGDSFDLTDQFGNVETYEFDSGYVLEVPRSFALQVPLAGGGAGGVADTETIVVTKGTLSVTLEFDNNGFVVAGNVPVVFNANSSQGEIADAIVAALKTTSLGLKPKNIGRGEVHMGVDGTQQVAVTSASVTLLGADKAINDGEQFTVDDGIKQYRFEFNNNLTSTLGTVRVPFDLDQTREQIAETMAATINSTVPGFLTRHVGDGKVHIGGRLHDQVTVPNGDLILTGTPGVRQPWGLRIPTVAGDFKTQIQDGQTFSLSNGTRTVTFEFDNNNSPPSNNVKITYTQATTTTQLANAMVTTIRNAGLGLFPQHTGNGFILLGGDATYSFNPGTSTLTQLGLPGAPGAVPIEFVPWEAFTAADVAQATADAINDGSLLQVIAEPTGDEVAIYGAANAVGPFLHFISSIKDLAGNSLRGNQINGDTRFTVFIGAGLDYGDAPAPYATLRGDDGARHAVLTGFSLGNSIDINADGQPSAAANGDDLDGDDEDGVTFDPNTPLIANRVYNLTVSTSGIGTVVPFGVLDAWIDFNRDGVWSEGNERILANKILDNSVLQNGQITFPNLLVPSGAKIGVTYARFRLSTAGNLRATGETDAGEVEDYQVTITSNPWQNPVNPFDVNNNNEASPIDVLLLINYINDHQADPVLPLPKPIEAPFYDVDGNGSATALDVLQLINHINDLNAGQTSGSAEGEGADAIIADGFGGEIAVGLHLDLTAAPSRRNESPLFQPLQSVSPAVARAEFRRGEVAAAIRASRQVGVATDHLRDVLTADDSWLDAIASEDRGDDAGRDGFFAQLGR